MPRPSPYVIVLSDQDRAVLEERARTYTAPYAQVVRAKIVLLAADGVQNKDIAARHFRAVRARVAPQHQLATAAAGSEHRRGGPDCLH